MGTVQVDRDLLTAVLQLAELGMAHCQPTEIAEVGQTVERLRAALADGAGPA